ncbi:MAG: DNA repair protein, partial [Myxococcota bacterium]
SELSHNYSAAELEEILKVLRHLMRAQSVLLKVNAEYIRSAGQEDKYRTEPPFKLQGSYRNMARIAERVVPAMTPDEVEQLLDDHYLGEAQTLTKGAEQNLLKLAELRERMTEEQSRRWGEIKRGFARHQVMGSSEEDPTVRALGQLAALTEQVGALREVVAAASEGAPRERERRPEEVEARMRGALTEVLLPRLESLEKALVEVARSTAAAATTAGERVEAPHVDLSPVIEKLGETLRAISDRKIELQIPPEALAGLAPLQRPLDAIAPPAGEDEGAAPMGPPGFSHQLRLIQDALMPLRQLSRRQLREGEGKISAMQVWRQVNEALQVVQAAALWK